MSQSNRRPNKLTDPKRLVICERYVAGESSNALGREFGVSNVAILQLLRAREITIRNPSLSALTPAQDAEMAAQYKAGETTDALATAFGVTHNTARKALRRVGVKERTNAERHRLYEANHAFFDVIDTERKAYWLGFIAADGYVNATGKNSGAEIIICLSIADEGHLLLLRDHLQSTHPVTHYEQETKKGARLRYVRFAIRSAQLANGLAAHGVTQAKTRTLWWPDLPQHLLNHYLRGYMDGDGGFYVTKPLKPGYRHRLAFRVTSNLPFLADAQRFMVQNADLSYTKIHEHKISPGIGTLVWGGALQVARIFDLVYSDATVFLTRKREKIEPYLF